MAGLNALHPSTTFFLRCGTEADCYSSQLRIRAPGFHKMASHTDRQNDTGHTNMAEHLKTWHGFISFMKWQAIGAAALLALLAIFRTHD